MARDGLHLPPASLPGWSSRLAGWRDCAMQPAPPSPGIFSSCRASRRGGGGEESKRRVSDQSSAPVRQAGRGRCGWHRPVRVPQRHPGRAFRPPEFRGGASDLAPGKPVTECKRARCASAGPLLRHPLRRAEAFVAKRLTSWTRSGRPATSGWPRMPPIRLESAGSPAGMWMALSAHWMLRSASYKVDGPECRSNAALVSLATTRPCQHPLLAPSCFSRYKL